MSMESFFEPFRMAIPGRCPRPRDYLVDRLAWFADGTRLVASGFSTTTNVPSIWLISTAGAEPRLLRTNARVATPSLDGTQVAFVSQDWSEIWVTGTHGEEPRKIVAGAGDDKFPMVFWSPDGTAVGISTAALRINIITSIRTNRWS